METLGMIKVQPRIVWNSSLETGIRAIDLQHEELIGMLNELADAVDHQQGDSVSQDILRRLDAYILFHFATEENLMRGLPTAPTQAHVAQHTEQHQAFIARIAALKAAAGQAPDADSEALLHYLRNWLLQHIMKTDRALAALLASGAKRPAGGQ